uniref:Immediate early response gene 5-like protein-like n=1 Tax=Saccoglossus kowalevskii TaxID=10224 RepID=A0ABM0MEL8_SACKO|nr:PREDICTED: immediate early response gene 5-like protein-like [Saccoglossus kowalevskii]
MSTDAQRLISVSFGKIASYRKQRGGLNLRKNLLVSYVIHNARTAIYEQMYGLQRTYDDSESEDRDELECTEDDDETAKPAWNDVVDNNDTSEQHENETAPKCEYEMDDERTADEDKENVMVTETNTPAKDKVEPEIQKDTCCHDRKILGEVNHSLCSQTCCNKRKRTELEDACESISPKRCKFEQDSESLEEHSMTVDQTQISNLVTRFNSGLSSLADGKDQHSSDSLSTENGANRNRLVSCLSHKNSTQLNTTTHLQQYSLPSTGVKCIENWARPIEAF